ncbi:1,4-dihydroxy-2-naphthoate polyprenyltransferase [Paenibacillus macquariensis]|uniref:1,4-dihydroxy-2-naphthoate octaprenyltransferase n=1 Tax=Paenibacillus macquariensis TaxID=948756 RepID=A0ABY1KA00_9BACL|nr:1,4-dihydroxy-2-naphthoate polyprenyltransferase [Paenibacillus macquariensis]MEC0092348.1 1,4-dihydroxy-2-naphthoate polyprenyltransferase [Paenibacillus macquariensis]OAB35324.1 1,4-dihydroxy-2-naphthoate polyprenyltransferase [Paenibacillus macquariensis subsp. macquariensis]SIR48595.1 1,4-dihydroxy-2-naphthoate octaprenyltransferase [Paenibacillus macquariensis]
MTLKTFLNLVEIRTKLASMIPFFLGSVYVVFRFEEFQIANFILMFVSLLTFDMFTTAMNNYYDFKKARKKEGYGYQEHNAIVKFGLKESTVVTLIITLFVTAVGTGMWLVFNTGMVVFLVGGLSFCVGILYSFGPIPISRMPLGELFSGLFMGFVIIFVATFIHVGDQLVVIAFDQQNLTLQIDMLEVLLIFLISIPAILCIANIMLANNICDMDEDVENKRYTLPVYIGKSNALKLFRFIYYVSYLDLIVLLFLKVNPMIVVLVLLTLIPLKRNISVFMKKQTKQHTFGLAVKNFLITNMARILVFSVAIVLAW